ncbi:MAG: glucosidase [Proteobacteria bacterium]|nr:glucosidase [Pseudomonadota bacterium]
MSEPLDPERQRLAEIVDDSSGWRRWGPYLSDRSWGTVREDYSANGNAWKHLPYDKARSKAYRWGEDGIAGICDRYQLLCLAPTFWNERDPHLKERFFGVDPYEGNHGEDVKEYYFHTDNTPTHAYMSLLYKYPQRPFPYAQIIEENQARHGQGPEYELLDTGVFDDDRYFDITIEYGKAGHEDLAMRITATNRGPVAAPLHILATMWFRNTWIWGATQKPEPRITVDRRNGLCALVADDDGTSPEPNIPNSYGLGMRWLYGPPDGNVLFTNNETNRERLYGTPNRSAFTKDAFHRAVCDADPGAVNAAERGTKAALHYRYEIPPGETVVLRLRFTDGNKADPLADVDAIIDLRKAEAENFYAAIAPAGATADERLVQRRALAGLLWSKQSYIFDVACWLDGDDPAFPPPDGHRRVRNAHWRHLNSMRVMSMPDKWEYPWFAAWDLAFQSVPLALVDPRFAKDQLWLLLFEQFQHPNGQLPAYEWEYNDLNPPVHAWAVWRVYHMDRLKHGGDPKSGGDRAWLERCFHKLLMNFASWVNKVDFDGNNVFEGGFLGLDNISVIDRSEPMADGTVLVQSDATGWMGMFCLNLMRIALELAKENPVYESLATKFLQHYTYVAAAMKSRGDRDGDRGFSLFDAEDGFFYDTLQFADGSFRKFRVRSLVGLIPLFAVERLESDWLATFPEFAGNFRWFVQNRRELVSDVIHEIPGPNGKTTWLLTIVNTDQLERMLGHVHDTAEFLSPYGIRSLSKLHETLPFELDGKRVGYEPAESANKIKGGNSNWRGPIWFPTTFLIIESLRKLGTAFGPTKLLRTTGSGGEPISLHEMARDIARRLVDIFLVDDATGQRPVFGGAKKFADDWRDHLLFYEYFHGDNGAGIGASHQTGWTALVANLIDEWPLPKGTDT